MTTAQKSSSQRGPLAVVLTASALTGIFLMGVPCQSGSSDSSPSGPDGPPAPEVTGAFVPSNPWVDQSISAAEAIAIRLEGIDGHFVFVGGQQWLEYEDGTALLTAEVADVEDRNRRFELSLKAVDPRSPSNLGDASFSLDLDPTVYSDGGGRVDPEDWTAFARFAGRLTGMRDLQGTNLTIELEPGTVLQIGEGANNVNGYYGAFASLLWHRAAGAGIPEGGTASASFTLQADRVYRALGAQSEQPYHLSGNLHAVTLPGIAQRMVFTAGGRLTERPDGTARLAGVLVDTSDPTRSFHMDLRLGGRIEATDADYPPTGSPKLELTGSSYIDSDGPVDPDTWTYYETFEGTLIGLGSMAGAEVHVERRGPAFQIGQGASGKNARLGGAGWLSTNVVVQPSGGTTLPATTGGDINIDLDESGTSSCASAAVSEGANAWRNDGHAFWIPGLARDLVFEPGAQFVEKADGSARLEGVLMSISDPTLRLLAGVDFADRVDPQGPGHAPGGSPKLELPNSSYVANGGSVDPGGWHYYTTTMGELKGLGRLRGARISIDRRGPAFQVGLGANGKNSSYGACGWLNVDVLAQPSQGPALPPGFTYGDININLGDDCMVCAVAATYNGEVAKYQGNHAFYLPGISHDFHFESGASFAEFSDGTAELRGVLMSPSRPGWRFDVVVTLGGRFDPGQAGYPPSGSPKRELIPASFVDQGGPIDTDSWRYYTEFTGRLTGIDAIAGSVVQVDRVGPAFQIGPGADGKNHSFGGAGWLDVSVLEQPTTGIAFPAQPGRGDINLDFLDGCMECAMGAPRDGDISRLPGQAAFYFGGLGSNWFDFEGPAAFTERANGTSHLTGILHDVEGGDQRWAVDLYFSSLSDPSSGGELPADSPKRDFFEGQYIDEGGTFDFMRWRYYMTTVGELTGLGQHAGARVRLWRMGPATQLGFGANGANAAYGLSGWLHVEVLEQPSAGPAISVTSGDFNLNVGDDCGLCASAAPLDSQATSTSGDHAFYLPGIGTDFVFVGDAPFMERADGTAYLRAEIVRPGEPNKRFRVDVEFSDRVDPGMANYPPAGSPKLELRTPYYITSGGLVDPSAWRYYETFTGTAQGLGSFEGAALSFSRMGEAFQIGPGASGKNVEFGGSGWMDVQIVQQPTNGPQLVIPPGFHGDMNFDLRTSCE